MVLQVSRPFSSLKHENLVELDVYNLYGIEMVLAYDFAPRGSLHDILHEHRGIGPSSYPYPALSWSQRTHISLDVARGLCYIHDKGLFHGNIRSRNVLLCDDGTAKIIDPFLWTQHPKQLARFYVGNDVYNFGKILLELLAGSSILQGDNTRRAEQHHGLWVCSTTTSF